MRTITTVEDWRDILALSKQRPVIVFKHSNMCATSAAVFDKMHRAEIDGFFNTPVHVVVTQTHQEVSDLIAQETGIHHESPQVLVLKDQEVILHDSHTTIDPQLIKEYAR